MKDLVTAILSVAAKSSHAAVPVRQHSSRHVAVCKEAGASAWTQCDSTTDNHIPLRRTRMTL